MDTRSLMVMLSRKLHYSNKILSTEICAESPSMFWSQNWEVHYYYFLSFGYTLPLCGWALLYQIDFFFSKFKSTNYYYFFFKQFFFNVSPHLKLLLTILVAEKHLYIWETKHENWLFDIESPHLKIITRYTYRWETCVYLRNKRKIDLSFQKKNWTEIPPL